MFDLVGIFFLSLTLDRFEAKEVKNSIFGCYCSMMVGGGYFRTFSHEHLPVGHTHEDIGASATPDTSLISLDLLISALWTKMRISVCSVALSAKGMTNCTSIKYCCSKAVRLSDYLDFKILSRVSRQHPNDVVEWHTQDLFFVSV